MRNFYYLTDNTAKNTKKYLKRSSHYFGTPFQLDFDAWSENDVKIASTVSLRKPHSQGIVGVISLLTPSDLLRVQKKVFRNTFFKYWDRELSIFIHCVGIFFIGVYTAAENKKE